LFDTLKEEEEKKKQSQSP